jgi:DDE superfamily endonuclease/Winged helix-turn helix
LRAVCQWLTAYSLSGVWRLLERWGLSYKRGRHYIHSPDPYYEAKRDYAHWCVAEARAHYPRVVTLYLDELTYYRQPSLASDWEQRGARHQPRAHSGYSSNKRRRVVATLDVVTGRVLYEQAWKIGVHRLAAFYPRLRRQYPEAEVIYVVQDNWPIHFWPEVKQAAEDAGIELVRLPTYAPWLNPVEKLWRKLKQEVLHMHRLQDDWQALQERVTGFLDSLATGSAQLLHYVGLLPD